MLKKLLILFAHKCIYISVNYKTRDATAGFLFKEKFVSNSRFGCPVNVILTNQKTSISGIFYLLIFIDSIPLLNYNSKQ